MLRFSLTEESYGEVKTAELKEGGDKIPVTKANREEYVELYCDYVLNKSVESKYRAFHEGFHKVRCDTEKRLAPVLLNRDFVLKVCGGRVLDLFHARELMTLVVGNENYNWKELEESTKYKVRFFIRIL